MLLTLRQVTKTYPTQEGPLAVLHGIDMQLDAGQSLALTGESGSGKSTLLHLVAGLDAVDSGTILLDGQDVARADDAARARMRRGTVGLVFQQFNLIPSLDVAANLAFQARLAGRHDPAWVAELAEGLGLAGLLARYPEQLSGGQQQRVAIGAHAGGPPPAGAGRRTHRQPGRGDGRCGDGAAAAAGGADRSGAADGHAFGAAGGAAGRAAASGQGARRVTALGALLSHWRRSPMQLALLLLGLGFGHGAVVGGAGDQRRGAGELRPGGGGAGPGPAGAAGRGRRRDGGAGPITWRCGARGFWPRPCWRAACRCRAGPCG
jgi:putative ABC transport system ATP-binding protein